MIPISSNQATSYLADREIPIIQLIQREDRDMSIIDSCQRKNSATEQSRNNNPILEPSKKCTDCLSVESLRKMAGRFLSEKQISPKKLAEALGVTVKELTQLFSQKEHPAVIHKINLPLIKLFCAKFNNQKEEKKDAINKS